MVSNGRMWMIMYMTYSWMLCIYTYMRIVYFSLFGTAVVWAPEHVLGTVSSVYIVLNYLWWLQLFLCFHYIWLSASYLYVCLHWWMTVIAEASIWCAWYKPAFSITWPKWIHIWFTCLCVLSWETTECIVPIFCWKCCTLYFHYFYSIKTITKNFPVHLHILKKVSK